MNGEVNKAQSSRTKSGKLKKQKAIEEGRKIQRKKQIKIENLKELIKQIKKKKQYIFEIKELEKELVKLKYDKKNSNIY